MPEPLNFLNLLTGSFATPAAENPTVAMIEAAYHHHGLDARYINCDVAPAMLGNTVRGANPVKSARVRHHGKAQQAKHAPRCYGRER